MKSYAVSSHGWHCRRSLVVTTFGGKRGSFAIAPTDGSSDRERHRVESNRVDSVVPSRIEESRRFSRNACTRSDPFLLVYERREKLGIKNFRGNFVRMRMRVGSDGFGRCK